MNPDQIKFVVTVVVTIVCVALALVPAIWFVCVTMWSRGRDVDPWLSTYQDSLSQGTWRIQLGRTPMGMVLAIALCAVAVYGVNSIPNSLPPNKPIQVERHVPSEKPNSQPAPIRNQVAISEKFAAMLHASLDWTITKISESKSSPPRSVKQESSPSAKTEITINAGASSSPQTMAPNTNTVTPPPTSPPYVGSNSTWPYQPSPFDSAGVMTFEVVPSGFVFESPYTSGLVPWPNFAPFPAGLPIWIEAPIPVELRPYAREF